MNKEKVYTKFNSHRKPKFNLRTEVAIEDGKKYIYKTALYEEGKEFIQHIYNSYKELSKLELPLEINKCKLVDKTTLRFEYIEGKSLLKEFEEIATSDDLDKLVNKLKEFEELLNKLPSKKAKLGKEFGEVFGSYEEEKEYDSLLLGILDLNLDNIIRDKDGTLHLIDYEWCFDFAIPKRYVLYRTIYYSLLHLGSFKTKKWNLKNLEKESRFAEKEIKKYFKWENSFQKYVTDKNGDYIRAFDSRLQINDTPFKRETLLINKTAYDENLNKYEIEINMLKDDKQRLEDEKQMLEDEKQSLEDDKQTLEDEKQKLEDEKQMLENEKQKLEDEKQMLENERNDLLPDAQEFRVFKDTKLWKSLTIYRKFKKYFKNFFINIFRDGPILTFKRIFNRIKNIIRCRTGIPQEINPYEYWLQKNKITKTRKKEILLGLQKLKYKPLISIVMPVYNVDVKWIKKAVKSVKNQIYSNWELCIADDASTNPQLIKYLKSLEKDPKIKITFREKNGHISEASNTALELVEGEFVALMDNDDIIHPHALAEIVKVLNKDKETDLIYSDEDKITTEEKRVEPFFKPDWSPDLFMSTNYLCHLTVIRKNLIDKVKGFRKGYEGSQDYDLFLRITELTDKIEHIPDILYSWRKIPGSTAAIYDNKGYADKASLNALKDAIKRRNIDAKVTKGLFPGSFRVKYKIKGNPLVSIIIPTKDKLQYIKRCISSLLEKTTYQNYEIIIIDTNSSEKETLDYYKTLEDESKIRILKWKKKFNYSTVNNFGVKNAKGEYILLLNNDTEIITPDWIEGMLEHAQRDNVGAVGVKLLYPNDTVQHVGIVLGIGGPSQEDSIAGHIMREFSKQIIGIPYTKDLIRNYSAVTAACLMIAKEKYQEVGGLKKKFRIAFNDVDFNLELMKNGYYNVFTPYVELYHHESVSVGRLQDGTRDLEEFQAEVHKMKEAWYTTIQNDPFYNHNLK